METKCRKVVAKGGEETEGELVINEYRVQVFQDEKLTEIY